MLGLSVNEDLAKMKNAVNVAKFKVLLRHLSGWNEEFHEKSHLA